MTDPKLAPWGDLPTFTLVDNDGQRIGAPAQADASRKVTLTNSTDGTVLVAIAGLFDGEPGPPITRQRWLGPGDTLSTEVTVW